ncbi:MAG: exo-beta-N-acetylmuramidase NamZ domain-containing protein [Hyphomicrobiaceae bacterium]
MAILALVMTNFTDDGRAAEPSQPPVRTTLRHVTTGADRLAASGFALLAGKRVGLIANHTARVGDEHLADLIARAPGVKLAAILAPEHGFRGAVEAGAKVGDDVDARTGAPVLSLYGATRKPTPQMLRGLDVLIFDIQDIGARFYTYISTLGLAMQAAAEAGIPLIVLDRPNPLGGLDVSGFVREPAFNSFVGQYPIPIVHGMTVGELARMIAGERWLDGLQALDLQVVEMLGWTRDLRWPATGRAWVATSPNIPTYASALAYPGIGVVGELAVNEGRGTPEPFTRFGARWLHAGEAARRLSAAGLPGVAFHAVRYRPRSIPHVATEPRFEGEDIGGVAIEIIDVDAYRPLEVGIHALVEVWRQAPAAVRDGLFPNPRMFRLIAGTERLVRMLRQGSRAEEIIASWHDEVERFRVQRRPYLIYAAE